MFDRIELFWFFKFRIFIVDNKFRVKLFIIRFSKDFISISLWFKFIDDSAAIVVAFECPRVGIFGCFEDGYSSCSLFRYMVIDIFAVHIFLGKVAAFVLENLAIH